MLDEEPGWSCTRSHNIVKSWILAPSVVLVMQAQTISPLQVNKADTQLYFTADIFSC